MQLNFKGKYSKDLFTKGVILANRPPKNRHRLLSVMLVIAIGSIGIIGYRIITTNDWGGNLVYLIAAVFMGLYVGQILIRPYFVARKLWLTPGTQRPLKGKITQHGITYMLAEGENFIEWGRFNRLQKTDDMVTLVREDGLLVIFPRNFFNRDGDWQKFIRLLEEKVASLDEKGIKRPVRS